LVSQTQVFAQEDDGDEGDDDKEDLGKIFGLIGIVLLGTGLLKLIPIYGSRIERKYVKKHPEKNNKRYFIRLQKKMRKPLKYLHYYCMTLSFPLLLFHGITFFNDWNVERIIGRITFSFHALFMIAGLFLWQKWNIFKDPAKKKKFRRYLYKFHRSLISLLIVFTLHFLHIILVD
jgi:hypothetical protein